MMLAGPRGAPKLPHRPDPRLRTRPSDFDKNNFNKKADT